MNTREPLENTEIFDGKYTIHITKVIGYGGSCIVYEGKEKDGCRVIVKEYYPKKLSLLREEKSDKLIVPQEKKALFDSGKKIFINGQENHRHIYEVYEGDGVLPRPFKTIEFNNTIYSVSDLKGGYTLAEIFSRENLTLYGVAQIMKQICNIIQKIHYYNLLYLDIKPDNFFYRKSDINNTTYIEIFDFDTLVGKDEIQNGEYEFCSYSALWAAPEQLEIDENGRYKYPERISYSTDYYAIGEVFFYLLTGRQPQKKDIDEISSEKFNWRKKLKWNASDETIELISNITRKTLNTDAKSRMFAFSYIENEEGELVQFDEKLGIEKILSKWFDELSVQSVSAKDSVECEYIDKQLKEASSERGELKSSIDKGTNTIINNIKENNLSYLLFGSKKKRLIFGITIFLVVSCICCISLVGNIFARRITSNYKINYENGFDNHLLLTLSNANHQYEVGLENWRRLDYNRAERDIKTARDEISKSVSQSEIDVATINNSLGCLYLDMGKYEMAYDYLNHAYVTFKEKYGEDSSEARSVLFSIAQYDYYTGDVDTAREMLQHIIDTSDVKNDTVIIAIVNHLRAIMDEDLGNYETAISSYKEVLALYDKFLENDKLTKELVDYVDDPSMDKSDKEYHTNALKRIILAYNGIGQVYLKMGSVDKAKETLENALDMSLNNIYIGTKNLITAKLYMNLATVKSKSGNISDAKDDIDLSMRIEKNLFDFEGVYPGLVEVYDVYGDIEYYQGDFNVANKYYVDALSLANSSFGEKHPETAEAKNVLGMYYANVGEYSKAISLFKESVEIRKDILGVNSISTVNYYINLANAYLKIKEYDNATDCVESAEKICDIIGANESVRDLIKDIKSSMRTVQTNE